MNYRSVLFTLLLVTTILIPVSASLAKIDTGATIFIGETGIDISSALNGCRQIAWWPAGNSTDTPPGKIVDIPEDSIFNYTITPARYALYTGTWYSWDKKPISPLFTIQKPQIELRIWDVDHDREVTGQTIAKGTRITYRIDTNMESVVNKYLRPDINPLDSFMAVSLTGPTGKPIESLYTGSAGGKDTYIMKFDSAPVVRASPYFWEKGSQWDHLARGGNGDFLYPDGPYTFVLTQNLNNMKYWYNETDREITSGKKTVTFFTDNGTITPSLTATTTTTAGVTPLATPVTTATAPTTRQPVATTPIIKTTWTSSPLGPEAGILAVCSAGLILMFRRKVP